MIRLSPLKLKQYAVEEFHVVARALELAEPTPVPDLLPEDLEVTVEQFHNASSPSDLLCRLQVKLIEAQKPVPYRFLVRLAGVFELPLRMPSIRSRRESHVSF